MNEKLEIGMGLTSNIGSDRYAYTIIYVSKDLKTIKAQEDKATLNENFKPEMQVGGFVGHVTNQDKQSYTYEADTNGEIIEFTLRKNGHWVRKGSNMTNGMKARIGVRSKFHDYNF